MIKLWISLLGSALFGAALLIVVPIGTAAAQGSDFAYPSAGQSQEQQARDHAECQGWAVQQTGVDPATLPSPRGSASARSGGFLNLGNGGIFRGSGLFGDAATGAGLGAIGGAIAGDVGVGAGIGALAGALFGAIGRSSHRHQRSRYQQADQYRQDQMYRYKQAYGACMSARHYSVR